MAQIRVFVSSNEPRNEAAVADLLKLAQSARQEAGCLQFEIFRSIEFAENLIQLELWESEGAFDAHWQHQQSRSAGLLSDLGVLQAPYHLGTPSSPRREGINSVELYKREPYDERDGIFVPEDEHHRTEFIRWPVVRPVRLISLTRVDPQAPTRPLTHFQTTRTEEGCIQFEPYESIEFPENALLVELWENAAAIERHWLSRLAMRKYSTFAPLDTGTPPPLRHGVTGREWYQQTCYELHGNVWFPENPDERVTTIRWV